MTFLELTNAVCQRLNEVELNDTNFDEAIGVYSQIKQAVNASLRNINQENFEWPFLNQRESITLSVNVDSYNPSNSSPVVNFDSFVLYGQNAQATNLKKLDYEQYLTRYPEAQDTSDTYNHKPEYVIQLPNGSIGFYPKPDRAYTVEFDYYPLPTELSNKDDVAWTPEPFFFTVVDGAMYYLYLFRGETDTAQLIVPTFESGKKNLRAIYQNRYEYVRSRQRPDANRYGWR